MTLQPLPRQRSHRLGSARLDSVNARRRYSYIAIPTALHWAKIWTAGNKRAEEERAYRGWVGGWACSPGWWATVRLQTPHPSDAARFFKGDSQRGGFSRLEAVRGKHATLKAPFPPEPFIIKAEGWLPLRDPQYIPLEKKKKNRGKLRGPQKRE